MPLKKRKNKGLFKQRIYTQKNFTATNATGDSSGRMKMIVYTKEF
jgi:hypothetical protein